MRIGLSFPAAVAALLAGTIAAHAQHVGTYTGTAHDGSTVFVTVGKDPNNGNFELKSLTFGVSTTCLKTLEHISFVGVSLGDGFDVVDQRASYVSQNFSATDLAATMLFHGTTQLQGTVGLTFAAIDPAFGHNTLTKKVQACFAPKQTFAATRSSDVPAAPALPPPAETHTSHGVTISVYYRPSDAE